MKRRSFLQLRELEQVFLSTGPARLRYGARQRNGILDDTRQTSWLVLKPLSIKFHVYSYDKKDKRTWSTSVSLSELKMLKTKCRETLARRALAESKTYLASLVLGEGNLLFEPNRKMDALFKNLLADDMISTAENGGLNLDSDDDGPILNMGRPILSKEKIRRMSSSTSKSKTVSSHSSYAVQDFDGKTKTKRSITIKKPISEKHIKKFERGIIKKVVTIQRFVRGFLARRLSKRLKRMCSVPKLYKEFIQEGEVN